MLAARAACRRVQQQPAHAASRWSPLTGSVGLLRSPAAPTSAPRRWSSDVRNVAIIAHVDHGKTTLMDKLLLSCEENGAAHAAAIAELEGDRIVDSMDQERERGITIVSKISGLMWGGTRLNIVDTPGHADFGGEVERVLRMVDGVILVVDATDGPNTQTTFVTEKALQHGLRPLVVLNKIDRDTARVSEVENEIFDLLVALGATDEQLDFEFIYASARDGWAVPEYAGPEDRPGAAGSMTPLMDAIVATVPPPEHDDDFESEPFALCVSMTSSDPFVGKLATGRVVAGTIKVGDKLSVFEREATAPTGAAAKVKEIRAARGMGWKSVESAIRGDIIQVAGFPDIGVGNTLGGSGLEAALPAPAVDPPTIAMTFSQNDSPVFGKDGTKLTSELIKERLHFETENNISIEVHPAKTADAVDVFARGEMQLGVLIESLRREGFELSISPPRVLFQEQEDGAVHEPIEDVTLEMDEDKTGEVIEQLTARKGTMIEMTMHEPRLPGGAVRARLQYSMPARGMVGYGPIFNALTRGTGVLNRLHAGYEPHRGPLSSNVRNGAIVSTATGTLTGYALQDVQKRGVLFVDPKADVYEGQVRPSVGRSVSLGSGRHCSLSLFESV
jgi:GTP-binding protein